MQLYFVPLFAVLYFSIGNAYPQGGPPPSNGPPNGDIFNMIGAIILSMNLPDIPADIAKIPPNQLASCVPSASKALVTKTCIGEKPPPDACPETIAECVLVNVIGALNNVTGQLNMTIFKAMTIEMNEMSETQKTATSAALDTCIASDLKLPTPPPNMDPEPLKEAIKKYGEKTHPLRVLFCLVKSLIQNGCATVKTRK